MENDHAPTRLDVKALALSAGQLAGTDLLSNYERLAQDLQGQGPDQAVTWSARGEARTGADGKSANWLHLQVSTAAPLVCQRCLGALLQPLNVSRAFRFVATEALALAQDDEVEEDLLVHSREFNLAELIEDELLLALPLIPRHVVCPTAVKLSVADADFETPEGPAASGSGKPNPFAGLDRLLTGK